MRTEERTTTQPTAVLESDLRPAMLQAATVLSWIAAALMFAAATAAVLSRSLFDAETPWAREAFRGGEYVSLLLTVPLLVLALVFVRRGSIRAQVVWIGVLLYMVYMYAFAVFGATFNDAFLLHIGVFSTSLFALACALPALDRRAIAEAFGANRAAKWVGVFLVVVGIAQGSLWLFVVIRNAFNGEVLHDIPVLGQHVVFSLDLGFLVPMLIVSGVLLTRRLPAGYLLGTAMAVMGAITQINLNVAAIVQDNADVPGVKALPAEGVFLTATFVAAALVMLLGGRTARNPARGT